MLPIPVLEESALSNYRTYIASFGSQKVRRGIHLNNFDRSVIEELAARLDRRPTRREILERMRQIIQIVEAEFYGPALPPRPHGL